MNTNLNYQSSKAILTFMLLCVMLHQGNAQSPKYTIYMDVSHNQKFWNDPKDMEGITPARI